MSWLSRFLHSIFDRPQSPPPVLPPVGPPAPPQPPPPGPPDAASPAARALAAMNARRRERGVGPLQDDAGLAAAAMELALPLAEGRARPHDGFPDRVRRHGWPPEDLGAKSGFGNTSEGISFGGQTPEEAVLILDGSPDPGEGHRRDFEDSAYTHVGIAIVPSQDKGFWTGGGLIAVVDYGARRR